MEFEDPEVQAATPAPGGQPAAYQGDPLYERQAVLGLQTPTVSVIGCGGVGCWVALSLVLGGVKHIELYDGDTLSLHNLNRFPLPPSANGEMKSVALARWLSTLRPDADIRARGQFIADVHTLGTNWVICATDSLKSRVMVYSHARDMGARYLEVGADGERWGMSPAPPEFQTELEDRAGYQTVPVHVGPCMMAGAAVAYYVLHNTSLRDSYMVDWDKGPVTRVGDVWGGLKVSKMVETPLPSDIKLHRCLVCSREIEVNLLILVRHLREERGLELVEAKALAEKIISDYEAASLELEEEEGPTPESDEELGIEAYDYIAEDEEARETENEPQE